MLLESVEIVNYRMLKDFKLDLKSELSLIVGKNNCGKTSLLTVMDKFLNFESNQFKWDDFNLDFQKKLFQQLVERVNEIEKGVEEDGIKLTLLISYDENDNYINIQNLMLDLNPENNFVVLEFDYSISGINFRKLKNDYENLPEKNFEQFIKYIKKNFKKYFNLTVYSRGYDIVHKKLTNDKSLPLDKKEVQKIIRFQSIKASREVSNKHNNHSLSSLSSRYYEYLKGNESETINEFEKAIMDTDESLNKIYENVFSNINQSVAKFGGVDGETQISIQSSLGEKELLSGNTTLYYKYDEVHLPESYNGLGYLNLIGIIFEIETIIAGFHGKENEEPADINILFIEEPEAHTHPQLQYIFIKNIKALIKERLTTDNHELGMQTIITTHSSHIVSECDFNDVRYLKKEGTNSVVKNFNELERKYDNQEAFKFVKQYLTLSRSELFFADKAIFIEGDTERILLPAMMKKVDMEEATETPLLSQNISIIEVGNYAHLFGKLISFLGIKALIITDIDAARYKEGKTKGVKNKCNPSDATTTSNSSLKKFLSTDDFHIIKSMNNKIVRFSQEDNKDKYSFDLNGNFRIAYQIEENGNQASSFEDAFIHLNKDFLKA
nr:AAA family ATPase [Mammaliicoccus lentus]